MFLLIDLSGDNLIFLALFDAESNIVRGREGGNRELLASIDIFFAAHGFKKEDLKGIMAVVGDGGFTSTRIACVVANTFGYVLNIPLLAIRKSQASNAQKLIPELLKQPVGQYISAEYSGEPNIGK